MSVEQYTISDLELPADEPMVIIRSSFLWICDGDKYAAAALNMYVRWTRWIIKHRPIAEELNRVHQRQGKKANQDTSLIIYRKQSAFLQDLLGFCSEKRLRQANDLLEAKGLLKIDDTPQSMSDHILKYELQIDVFKEKMAEWKKQRKKATTSVEDDVTEVSSEASSTGTDNLPSRSGKNAVPSSVRNGKFTDRSGKFTASINRGYKIDDQKERDSVAAENQTASTTETTPPTPQKLSNEKKIDLFRSAFIALGKEMFAYDKFTACRVQPDSEVASRILEIIGDGEVSAQAMRTAFLKLWNHKDKDGTSWWQDKSKLTLKAFVNNYDDQDTTQQENKKRSEQSSSAPTPLVSRPTLAPETKKSIDRQRVVMERAEADQLIAMIRRDARTSLFRACRVSVGKNDPRYVVLVDASHPEGPVHQTIVYSAREWQSRLETMTTWRDLFYSSPSFVPHHPTQKEVRS